jgi:membrane-associated protease RseP (regulator of RpoE activity)
LVDGARMPFDDKITTDTPGGDQTMQVDTVELNKTLPDVVLARPGSVHKAMFSGGASSTGWIPFELSGGHIYFPVKVNGHDVVVMIDSGAEVSVMDKTLAGSMGLESKGETAVQGSSGDQAAGLVSGVTVEVGNLKLSGLTVISTDLKSLESFVGHSLPFILGDDLFNEVAVDIDFANRRIAFRDPAHLARPEGAAEVPLNKLQALRSIPVSFEGGPTVDVHFDLGNGGSVMVYPAYAKAHGLPGARRTSQRLSGGAGGALPETTAILRKLQFAGVTFTDVPAIFPPDTIASVNSGALAGNVGLPIFSRFHMVIDFSHDRLWMTPAVDAATAPFAKDRLGLFLAPKDGALQVVFVSPGSPAEKAGLKAGDRIRLIDHKASAAWSTDALAKLGAGAAGTRVELTLADGKIRRLTLKDYF